MGAAGSVNKVFWSELDIALHETALDLLGAEAEVESTWLDGYTFSLSGPIYAGTNEIQRNIVAERILGLPREPKGQHEPSEVRPRRTTSATSRRPSTRCCRRPTPSRSPAPGPTATAHPGSRSGRGSPSRVSCRSPPTPPPSSCAIAFEALGRYAVPGPWVESAAYLPIALGRRGRGRRDGRRPAARAVRARRRRRRPGVRRQHARPTDVGELRRLGRPDPSAVPRRRPAAATSTDRTRPSTWRCSRRPPSCSAPASGCSRLGDLREAAQAVRPRDRVLPGDQARAGRRPHRPRLRPAAGLRRRAR